MGTLPTRFNRQVLLVPAWKPAPNETHLLIANARQVPDHEPPVSPTGGQDGLVLGAPSYLEHFLIVVLKHVQVLLDHPQIVQGHLQDRA